MATEEAINLFRGYIDRNYSVIPNRKIWDKKNHEWTGKIPAVKEWSDFCNTLTTNKDVDNWTSKTDICGISIVTGSASNICCVDIDTEDPELQAKIKSVLPYTPVWIKGNPKRGGKYIFRLTDNPSTYVAPANKKIKISDPANPRRSVVDIFLGNAYICIPPSLHSIKDNVTQMYEWGNEHTLENTLKEHLPVLNLVVIDKIRMIIGGLTRQQVDKGLPSKSINLSGVVSNPSESTGRWQHMTSLAGKLIRERRPVDEAVIMLLREDKEQFSNNLYFLDKTKGCKTNDPKINAYKFYCDILHKDGLSKGINTIDSPKTPQKLMALAPEMWKEIIPLDRTQRADPFDEKWMPKGVRQVIMDASEVTAVPPQSIFFYMLSTFSSLLGNKIVIQPYHLNTEYTETSNLYVGIVAKSGERKTETTKIARKALMRIQKEEQSKMEKIAQDGASINENIEIRLAQIRKDLEKEVKANGIKSEYGEELKEESKNLVGQIVKHKKVSLYEQYATAEKYYQIVEENPYGIFLEFNEWGSAYRNFHARGNEKLREFIMNGWDGNRPFTYRTKQNGENSIEKLCLSVGFCVQEDVMASLLWRIGNIGEENDGLTQRFMLILSDDILRPVIDKNFIIPESYYEIFRNAYSIPSSEKRLLLEFDAYHSWISFQGKLKEKERVEKIDAIKSFLAKYSGMVIRIASNLECMKNNGKRPTNISLKTYLEAEEIVGYLESNVRALFRKSELIKYNEIIDRLRMSIIEDGTTIRELTRQHKGLFGATSEEAMVKLKVLHDHNYIRLVREGKSYKLLVNPSLT